MLGPGTYPSGLFDPATSVRVAGVKVCPSGLAGIPRMDLGDRVHRLGDVLGGYPERGDDTQGVGVL